MIIAITGSLGSGKTVVSSILRSRGYRVLSSDKIANDLLAAPNETRSAIAGHFGSEVLGESGEIVRSKLANIVFNDKDQLSKLNELIHPAVVDQILQIYKDEKPNLPSGILFVELPLFIESKFYDHADRSILVTAPLELKLKFMGQKGLSAEDARRRLGSQASDEDYRIYIDYEIANDADIFHVETQLNEILKIILSDGPDRKTARFDKGT